MNQHSPGRGRRAPAPRLRARFQVEARAIILSAAEEVFGEVGLQAASMNEVARRAGVAVGTLYNHFADREALLDGLTGRRFEELTAQLDAGERAAGRAFRPRLSSFVGTVLATCEAHRALFLLLLSQDRPLSPRRAAHARALHRRIDRLVRGGIAEGVLKPADAPLYGSFLLGLLRAVITRVLYVGDHAPLGQRAAAVVDFFLHGAAT
jgi:AcrR family transcriptional regulator